MKIDLGPIDYLDMDVVTEAPSWQIFLGRRQRHKEPLTTQRLADTIARWQAEQPVEAAVR